MFVDNKPNKSVGEKNLDVMFLLVIKKMKKRNENKKK